MAAGDDIDIASTSTATHDSQTTVSTLEAGEQRRGIAIDTRIDTGECDPAIAAWKDRLLG